MVKLMYSDLKYNEVPAFYKPSNPKTFPVLLTGGGLAEGLGITLGEWLVLNGSVPAV